MTKLPHPPLRRQPGMLMQLFTAPTPVLDDLFATYGPVSGVGGGPAKMAVVGGAAELAELFAMPTSSFIWGHKFNALAVVVGPGSMIVSDGDDHARLRGAVQTAFSRRRLNGWIPMIVSRTDDALATLPDEPTSLDMFPVIRSLLIEIVVHAFFGPKLAERAHEFGALFQRAQDYLEMPAYKQVPHPFPAGKRGKVKADCRAIDRIIDEEIADRRAATESDPKDLLAGIVADGTLTDDEIKDQVRTLIGAGYDTTAASLAWMLTRLARTPEAWDRMGVQAAEVFAGDLGAETPARLTEADAAMRETMRLHPAGVVSPRETAVPITLGGIDIPKGTLILWSAHLAGRDPAVWDAPLEFRPERWSEATEEQRRVMDVSWVPFGGGRRNCIGFALAQLETTLISARLAQHLSISSPVAEVPEPAGMVVNRPAGGVPLRVARR